MKIYISWSKILGYFAAKELVQAMNSLFIGSVEPYFSALSIESGKIWFAKNQEELLTTDRALILVTKQNLQSPWLLYEAGTLLGRVNNKCEILLLDLGVQDLESSPFMHFQCTDCRTSAFSSVFDHIRNALDEKQSLEGDATLKIIEITQTNIILMSRAEQDFARYHRIIKKKIKGSPDQCIYDICNALVQAQMSESDIDIWMKIEKIPSPAYSYHLVDLMQKPAINST